MVQGVLQVVNPVDHAARAGYGALAPFYDAYTDHPAYAGWIRGLCDLARRNGGDGDRILDVACGTGKSLAPLLSDGAAGVGVDAVPEMLTVAARKLGPEARLLAHDMTTLPEIGTFDLAFCINDALNCLLTEPAVAGAFRSIARNLRPGGVLVFDTSRPLAYEGIFAGTHDRTCGDTTFRWRGGGYDGSRAVACLDVLSDEGRRLVARSIHVQQHHPDALIERLLAGAGLEILAREGQHDDGSRSPDAGEEHFKSIYVVRKADRAPSSVMRSRALHV